MKTKTSTKTLAIISLLIVALGYSLLNVGSRFINEGLAPMTGVYVRVGIATLVAAVFFWKKLRWKNIKTTPRADWIALTLMGTLGYAIAVYFITLGALTTKLINVTVVFATLPFFTFIFSRFFLRQATTPKIIPFLLASSYGVLIVATKSFIPSLPAFGRGELFVLLAAAGFAIYAIGRQKLSDHLNNEEITVIVMAIASVAAFTLAIVNKETFSLSALTNSIVLLGVTIGVTFNIVSTFFENFAFEHLDATFGTQLLLTDNVFSAFLGYFLYREFLSPVEVIGGLIVIGSVYLTNKLLTS